MTNKNRLKKLQTKTTLSIGQLRQRTNGTHESSKVFVTLKFERQEIQIPIKRVRITMNDLGKPDLIEFMVSSK